MLKAKLLKWAISREIKRHGPEIRAEIDRLKGIRTLAELKAFGREKGGALGALTRTHGPELLEYIKNEWARVMSHKGGPRA